MTQKTITQRIEQVVSEEIARGRFAGTAALHEADVKPCWQAGIDTQTLSQIEITYNPDYETTTNRPAERVARDIVRHEINHRKHSECNGCPRNLEYHVEKIIEPLSEVLLPQEFGSNDVHYVANCLEDTLLHEDLNKIFSLDGITDFFLDVGEHLPKQKYTPFYEAHVRLNLYLWGSKKQKKALKRFFTQNNKDTEATQVLRNFLQRTGLNVLKEQEKLRAFCNDESNWSNIARIYGEEFSKLMQPNYACPIFNHSGQGTSGKEVPIPARGSSQPKEGNPFDKQMYLPEHKQSRIKRAYEAGQGIPGWLSYFEALDLLYQSLAQKLKIHVESFTQQSSMPLFHYGTRPFDHEKDNLKKVTFGFDDKGHLELRKRRYHEDMPLEYKVNPQGFPQARVCLLDTSESMRHAPSCSYGCNYSCQGRTNIIPWGDKSKYHYALLGWYGLLEYLKQNHLLNQTGIGLGNVSTKTILAEGLIPAKELGLTPQWGNTLLDLNSIKKMFKERGMLIFSISDGEIQNWDAIKKDFVEYAQKHYYFHLQIGSPNGFTSDLEEAGLTVKYIQGSTDLANTMIELTDKLFRG